MTQRSRGLRLRTTLFALLAALLLLPGPGFTADGKVFRWSFQGDVLTLDPYHNNETMTLGFLNNIYEGLVRRGRNMELEPALATEWTTRGPDVWRFKLRAGVKFQDGSPFTADDVLFSFERARSEASDIKPFVAGIKEIRRVDDLTVDVITDGPRPILLNSIARWYILPKAWFEKHNTVKVHKLGTAETNHATLNASGTGPFMIKSRQPDVQTVLVPNPGWWDRAEHTVSEAIFRPIKSDATRVAGLLSGELDMMYPVPLQDVSRIDRSGGVRVIQNPEVRTIFLGMDLQRDELLYSSVKGKNPFKDRRVRQAMYQAIDIKAIHEKVMFGASRPTGLLIGPGITGFDPALDQRLPHDVAGARRLLAEAGYPNGFEVTFDCPNDRYVNDESICQAVTAMLARVGVKARLNAQTKAKHFQKITAKDTSFFLLGWTPASLDMHETFSYIVSTGSQWNCGGYSNPRVDGLLKEIATEVDARKRQALIAEAMRLHREDIGHLPLHQQALAWGVKSNVDLAQLADNTFGLRWVRIK
jgi:peptide/nickel transport system substrate-binding protein